MNTTTCRHYTFLALPGKGGQCITCSATCADLGQGTWIPEGETPMAPRTPIDPNHLANILAKADRIAHWTKENLPICAANPDLVTDTEWNNVAGWAGENTKRPLSAALITAIRLNLTSTLPPDPGTDAFAGLPGC